MSKPKSSPPYRVTGKGVDAWIIDSAKNDVVLSVCLSSRYDGIFKAGEIMQILCDALNRKETP